MKQVAKVDPARSAQMALVRSRDTKPEMRVRTALHAAGLRYRLHDRRLPGAPDLVFPSRRIVLFVHGCFWHRHDGCSANRLPKSRLDFWIPKLEGNAERDQRQQAELEALGWRVLVVWECETKTHDQLAALAKVIRKNPLQRSAPPAKKALVARVKRVN
ncbi:very short patch repair endonuclease [Nevskia soli]|uniref:very short patch repair endonuclease n=1 Tax=Nevskia soli TaxID=418856 RepID=UPI000A0558E0|nr:very short patch repair endonuclease [Nevskia soli]